MSWPPFPNAHPHKEFALIDSTILKTLKILPSLEQSLLPQDTETANDFFFTYFLVHEIILSAG